MRMPINWAFLFLWDPTLLQDEEWHHLPQLLHSSFIWVLRVHFGLVSGREPNFRGCSKIGVIFGSDVSWLHCSTVILLTVGEPPPHHLKVYPEKAQYIQVCLHWTLPFSSFLNTDLDQFIMRWTLVSIHFCVGQTSTVLISITVNTSSWMLHYHCVVMHIKGPVCRIWWYLAIRLQIAANWNPPWLNRAQRRKYCHAEV